MPSIALAFNRHHRRAAKVVALRRGISTQHNGVPHDTLTTESFTLLTRGLVDNGNILSAEHGVALYALVGLMTKSAQGLLPGRIAFGLPTGMGKTSAIVAWCATLVRLRYDHISVAVAASKVEDLCKLKKDLIRLGVPEERIGLLYADGGTKYSLPRTEDNDDRQIMLIAHARVRSPKGMERFNTYRGKPRSTMFYDESLITSDTKGISVRRLRAAIGYLRGLNGNREDHGSLLRYLDAALSAIETALTTAKTQAEALVVVLPKVDEAALAGYRSVLPPDAVLAPIYTLLDLLHEDLRVVPTGDGGAVWYEVVVPPALENIIILDASYPIRELMKADPTIKDAQEYLPEVQRIGVPLSKLKAYDNVTLHQMFVGGGRSTMQRDFKRPAQDRKVTKEIIEVVKTIPKNEAVLIFVFKTRPGEETDYTALMLADLRHAGIDTAEKFAGTVDGGETKELRRVNVATWGMETSLNIFAHCQHVILAGVLQRSSFNLAGAYLGQVNDLRSEVTPARVQDLARSEVCHVIYQALSRGSCRVMDNGKARRMTGYVLHRDPSIQPVLSSVMPGASWCRWDPKHIAEMAVGAIATTTLKAVEHLRSLPPEVVRISSRKLKEDAGLRATAQTSFSLALAGVSAHTPWRRDGRSLVRTFALPT